MELLEEKRNEGLELNNDEVKGSFKLYVELMLSNSYLLHFQELRCCYKYKNNKLPHYLQSLPFYPNTETHDHATRIQHNIHEAKTNHTFAKNYVHFDIP